MKQKKRKQGLGRKRQRKLAREVCEEAGVSGSGPVVYPVLGDQWCWADWPGSWHESGLTRNIAFLDLFPTWGAVTVGTEPFRDKAVIFWSANMAVVECINRRRATCPHVVRLLRHPVLRCLKLTIDLESGMPRGCILTLLILCLTPRYRYSGGSIPQRMTEYPDEYRRICAQPGRYGSPGPWRDTRAGHMSVPLIIIGLSYRFSRKERALLCGPYA
mgnify:CR=1 FL=1